MMKSLIQAIFGLYTPVTYIISEKLPVVNQAINNGEVYTYDSVVSWTNSYIPSGMSGVDWEYVLGVFGFFLVVYCIMRIIGAVIKSV